MKNSNIQIQDTPNPDSIQFVFPKKLTNQAYEFKNQKEAHCSPLAQTLLGFPWMKQVFISNNFIALTKEDWVEWDTLKPPLLDMMNEHFQQNKPIVIDQNQTSSNTEDSEIVQKIKNIIDTEIQPAVQMDGGFIQFSNYKQGKVYLRLQGACSGCPSAEWTLKQGIETRIKQEIPQVTEVVSI